MIKVTEKYIDGVRFIDKLELVDTGDRRYGIPIHYVADRLLIQYGVALFLRTHGLTKVGESLERCAAIYVSGHVNPVLYFLAELLFKLYYKSVWWSYNNLRMFKQIPEANTFSWRYFTPYTWFKRK